MLMPIRRRQHEDYYSTDRTLMTPLQRTRIVPALIDRGGTGTSKTNKEAASAPLSMIHQHRLQEMIFSIHSPRSKHIKNGLHAYRKMKTH